MLARTEWIDEPTPGSIPVARRGLHRKAADALRTWRKRIRQRDALAALTERDLRDARITRADVMTEIAKPFWRA
jgi:uncharacterized protein YjiS (DUF1127 family)